MMVMTGRSVWLIRATKAYLSTRVIGLGQVI